MWLEPSFESDSKKEKTQYKTAKNGGSAVLFGCKTNQLVWAYVILPLSRVWAAWGNRL